MSSQKRVCLEWGYEDVRPPAVDLKEGEMCCFGALNRKGETDCYVKCGSTCANSCHSQIDQRNKHTCLSNCQNFSTCVKECDGSAPCVETCVKEIKGAGCK